ncbi:integral membrane protein, YccS/YhfK family [Hafnia alvei]|uniref:Integral membrane protein, YccS/YhfK family n=1 Tax=Hafnia alvei TaxID=569 RepID=A0A377PP91_HAFAL|nr:integral membrane protein, YccS/YhfK family [Hafnia alvei]
MLGLALLLGVNGEISPLHARLMPAALVASIFTLSMAGSVPIWHGPLLYIVGTIWYGAFTWFLVPAVEGATDPRKPQPALRSAWRLHGSQIQPA